jgi:hypothetical protein
MPGKKTNIDYRLSILPHRDAQSPAGKTLVVLETVREFASFRYDLAVTEEKNGQSMRYTVTGLRPPDLSLPSSGPAQFFREYSGLSGTCEFIVVGLDHRTNSFLVRIGKRTAALLQSPEDPFVEINLTPGTDRRQT